MSEVQAPGISREITIYATRGGQMQKITTDVTTWGELQPLVRNAGFDLSSLLAAENVTKTDLVNDLAVLPTSAFRLFLRPKQTKSGALDRKECFAAIKVHLLNHPEDKAKFSINGRNVTQLPTATVQELVAKYCVKATTTANSRSVNESVKEVVGALPEVDDTDLTDVEKVEEAIALISSLDSYEAHYKANKHLGRLLDEVSVSGPSLGSSEEDELAREARELGY
jgi:hypothetical protein